MSEQQSQKRPRCRFDLFVRLRPGIPSRFYDLKRTWCYRGDKFTDVEAKMIRNLVNHLVKGIAQYDLVELYDNNYTQGNPQRIVVKISDGVVITNQLDRYQDLLINFELPKFLQL